MQESDSVENSDEAVMNYVVNLKEDTAGDVLDKAVAGAESLQAYKLMAYPEISVFFVQAHTKTFATDFAQWAAKNGIAVDSVAPTRDTLREERFVPEASPLRKWLPLPNGIPAMLSVRLRRILLILIPISTMLGALWRLVLTAPSARTSLISRR